MHQIIDRIKLRYRLWQVERCVKAAKQSYFEAYAEIATYQERLRQLTDERSRLIKALG